MATATLTAAQADLISSLSQDDIPIKLRCAICSKLAVNAFRLPCCEQAICESCQSSLPSTCPVCEHTPIAAEDCKPNKSLRTTIKVFLRTEEKKREALRLKDLKNTSPITPPTPATPLEAAAGTELPLQIAPHHPAAPKDGEPEIAAAAALKVTGDSKQVSASEAAQDPVLVEVQQDIPQPSIEEIAPGQEQTEEDIANANGDGDAGTGGVHGQPGSTETVMKDLNGLPNGTSGMAQSMGFGLGFGFDPTAASGFPNMGLMGQGGDFNQMQMMMAMQNGMTPNAFGTFPMMGMPGMAMDPMAMQNMYLNGGFGAQGMGMNGMNMGMGMAGYDGGVGTGFNNGWNGQQSWNIGQDNFNHPNAAGIGHGDYSSNNTGFQHAAGYNQGNYGRANQYNDYQQNGYGHQNFPRGRGRGRGFGYGPNRGGPGFGHNDILSNQPPNGIAQSSSGSMSDNGSIPTGPKADLAPNAPPASNVDKFGREIRSTTEAKVLDDTIEPDKTHQDGNSALKKEEICTDADVSQHEELQATADQQGDDAPQPIQTLEQIESNPAKLSYASHLSEVISPSVPLSPSGPSIRGQGVVRGGLHGSYHDRSVSRSMQPPQIPALTSKVVNIPINAPTGPKAMREGLPNTSLVNLRGRGGFPFVGRGGARPSLLNTEATSNSVRSRSQSPLREKNDRDRSRSPSGDEGGDRDRDKRGEKRRRHRHRSTSQSEDEKDEGRRSSKHRRRRRHGSASSSEDGKEEESRKLRRSRRERKHDEDVDDTCRDDEHVDGENKINGDDVERSRTQSPAESRRSSHRSRRERDRERERDKDRERDREHKSSSHKQRSSHRSHRDRSRSRSRDHEQDRSRHTSREREREHRRRRRHNSTELREKEKEKETGKVASLPPTTPIEKEKPEVRIPIGPRAMYAASTVTSANGVNGNGVGIEIKGASARRKSIQEAEDKQRSSRSGALPRDEDRRGKDRDRDRERERERDRDRETERSRHGDRRSSASTSTRQATSNSSTIPTGPSAMSKPASTKGPPVDPHTLEREARNRERLLKEAQRIAGLAAAASAGAGGSVSVRKRSRDDGVDDSRKGRKLRKSEADRDRDGPRDGGHREREKERGHSHREREDDEQRIARLEGEREAGRWA